MKLKVGDKVRIKEGVLTTCDRECIENCVYNTSDIGRIESFDGTYYCVEMNGYDVCTFFENELELIEYGKKEIKEYGIAKFCREVTK
jgi:hypothetical protein